MITFLVIGSAYTIAFGGFLGYVNVKANHESKKLRESLDKQRG